MTTDSLPRGVHVPAEYTAELSQAKRPALIRPAIRWLFHTSRGNSWLGGVMLIGPFVVAVAAAATYFRAWTAVGLFALLLLGVLFLIGWFVLAIHLIAK